MTSTFAGTSYFNDSKDIFKYRNKNMCDKWKKDDKSYGFFSIKTQQNRNGEVLMYGKVNNTIIEYLKTNRIYLRYWAANPPTTGSSFSGSGLPYPNEDVAYENTSNQGNIEIYDINFSLKFIKPNSYYTNQGKELVKPHVNFMFTLGNKTPIGGIYKKEIEDYIPYRTLSMVRKDVMFYKNFPLPVRSQEQILRDSGYPEETMTEEDNFWGLKPPN